jgi:hypothetical protein
MTIVAACKDPKSGDVYIGSDLQLSYGETSKHKADGPKWLDIGGKGLLGWSGNHCVPRYLEILTFDTQAMADLDLDTRAGVIMFAEWLRAELEDQDLLLEGEEPGIRPMVGASFLLATPKAIWQISSELTIVEKPDFYAIGTGARIANGAWYVLSPMMDDGNSRPLPRISAPQLLSRVLAAACEYDDGCCWPTEPVRVADVLKQPVEGTKSARRNTRKSRER